MPDMESGQIRESEDHGSEEVKGLAWKREKKAGKWIGQGKRSRL